MFWLYHGPYTSNFGLTRILWFIKFYNFSKSNSWSLYIFWLNISFYGGVGQGWIRISKLGFAWKDITVHQLLFSERNGYTKTLKVGRYSFKSI